MSGLQFPDQLYRGVTLDPAIAENQRAFSNALHAKGGLHPGSLKVNARGQRCVYTGDEYGVYLTPEPTMGDSYGAYSIREHLTGQGAPLLVDGKPVEYTLEHPALGRVRTALRLPSLGILYEINTAGLPGLRPPTYRAGRKVTALERNRIPEWIADEVPESHVRPARVLIGPDVLSEVTVQFSMQGGESTLRRRVSSTLSARIGSLTFLAQQLRRLPNRHNAKEVARVVSMAHAL